MIVEYRDETKPRTRGLIFILVVSFSIVLSLAFISIFGVFEKDALNLLQSALRGEPNSAGGLFGYFLLLIISVGLPVAMICVTAYHTVLKPDHSVKIDPNQQIVSIRLKPLWRDLQRNDYAFSDIEAIELKDGTATVSEKHEIWLHIPDPKTSLCLTSIFDSSATHKEFEKLKNMGLPSK